MVALTLLQLSLNGFMYTMDWAIFKKTNSYGQYERELSQHYKGMLAYLPLMRPRIEAKCSPIHTEYIYLIASHK